MTYKAASMFASHIINNFIISLGECVTRVLSFSRTPIIIIV
jgi:hypothetical protein